MDNLRTGIPEVDALIDAADREYAKGRNFRRSAPPKAQSLAPASPISPSSRRPRAVNCRPRRAW
ncbi:hypothetical protein DFR71_6155 [Nocardia alba]|uniref:Uncharacterized protein n=1 Tax=Nocardia alba TaxID=225051 RepID=A0A4R1F6D2_9NOCA|nr:hypothetical protein DFR71_6155 [Nocardia alba]